MKSYTTTAAIQSTKIEKPPHTAQEAKVEAYCHEYFVAHGELPSTRIVQTAEGVNVKRQTVQHVLRRLREDANYSAIETTYINSSCSPLLNSGSAPPLFAFQPKRTFQRQTHFTANDARKLDDAFALLRRDCEKGNCRLTQITLNVPSSSDIADRAICTITDTLLPNLAHAIVDAAGGLNAMGVVERQRHNDCRLHFHIYVSIPQQAPSPTIELLTDLWKQALPSAAFVGDNGSHCEIEAGDVHLTDYDDFSTADLYDHCYGAKRTSKCGKKLADGTFSRPNTWLFIDQDLRHRSNQEVLFKTIYVTSELHASQLIAQIKTTLLPENWKETFSHDSEKRVTGHLLKLAMGQQLLILPELEQFLSESSLVTTALTRIKVNLEVHPNGLIKLTSSKTKTVKHKHKETTNHGAEK